MESSQCLKEQAKFDQDRLNGLVASVAQRPMCDGSGYFEPIKCIPGQTCFCVSDKGKRIFGEYPENSVNPNEMNCGKLSILEL